MSSILNRLKALEDAVKGMIIPSEREFWRQWETFDPLTKSIYEATAANRIWELETDADTRRYFETVSGYLVAAGIVTEGEGILDLAAELEAERDAV